MGRSMSGGVETVHWASLDEWGAELPGGRDAGAGGLWAGLEGLCGPGGGWSAGPRAHSPASRAFLSPDPEAPDASDPATAAAYSYAEGSPLSMVDPSGGRAVLAQDPLGYLGERMSDAGELLAGGARDVAELAGIVDRRTESYAVPLCGGLLRGQRTEYGVNWHGVLNVAGMIPGVGPWADLANAGPCAWEGDWLGAGQSLWSALPGIGDAFQGTKVATGASKFASHADDVAGAVANSRRAAFRQAKRDLGIPVSRQPDKVHKVIKDRHGKVIPGGRGYQFDTGVIIGENGSPKVLHRDIFDHPNGHVFPDGGRVGPHFNTQVVDKDKMTWGKEHYWYGKGT